MSHQRQARKRITVIGAGGFNAQRRVIPALASFRESLEVTGFDIRSIHDSPIPIGIVDNDCELARSLHDQKPNADTREPAYEFEGICKA